MFQEEFGRKPGRDHFLLQQYPAEHHQWLLGERVILQTAVTYVELGCRGAVLRSIPFVSDAVLEIG